MNPTPKESARRDGPENRAEGLFSSRTPSLRALRGIGPCNVPGYSGGLQVLRNVRQRKAFEQAALSLQAAFDPAMASRAKRGEGVTSFAHFDLPQTAIN